MKNDKLEDNSASEVIPDNLLLGVEEIKDMFWDKISPLYDIFENIYNGKVYTGVEYHVVDGRMPCAIAVITKA